MATGNEETNSPAIPPRASGTSLSAPAAPPAAVDSQVAASTSLESQEGLSSAAASLPVLARENPSPSRGDVSDPSADMGAAEESASMPLRSLQLSGSPTPPIQQVSSSSVPEHSNVPLHLHEQTDNTSNPPPERVEFDYHPAGPNAAAVSKGDTLPFMDRALLRVPYECAVHCFRTLQKQVERDVRVITAFIEKKLPTLNQDDAQTLDKVDKIIEKLEAIKAKIVGAREESDMYLRRCEKRLERLATQMDIQEDHLKPTFCFDDYSERVAMLLHEYLIRAGFSETASSLLRLHKLQDLVDPEVHEAFRKVVTELENRSTKAALEWCALHRSRLKKLQSTFETEVHIQQVISMLAERKTEEAVVYIRNSVTPAEIESFSDSKKALTMMVMQDDLPPEYAELLGDKRWQTLIERFRETAALVYGFSRTPVVEVVLQAGFSALKSEVCKENKSSSCPGCLPEWAEYVGQIPTPHRVQSCLICPLTGDVMGADNPPLAGPNGNVYSQSAVTAMIQASNNEVFVDPKTKQKMKLTDFTKIYVT